MASILQDRVLDSGLSVLDTEATHIYICSADPTTYTEATSTYALGNKSFGAGNVFGSPEAASPNGRKVTSAAVTDGAINANGTAAKWAVVDATNIRLLANGQLSASQGVTSGVAFSLNSFDIRIPNQ